MTPQIDRTAPALMPAPTAYTYRLDVQRGEISGMVDGLDAMKQAIYLILSCPRFENAIFSWNYGSELGALVGKPLSWAIPEIRRRVEEALLQDSRIKSLSDFRFEKRRGAVSTSFTAHTAYGPVDTERTVVL